MPKPISRTRPPARQKEEKMSTCWSFAVFQCENISPCIYPWLLRVRKHEAQSSVYFPSFVTNLFNICNSFCSSKVQFLASWHIKYNAMHIPVPLLIKCPQNKRKPKTKTVWFPTKLTGLHCSSPASTETCCFWPHWHSNSIFFEPLLTGCVAAHTLSVDRPRCLIMLHWVLLFGLSFLPLLGVWRDSRLVVTCGWTERPKGFISEKHINRWRVKAICCCLTCHSSTL